MVVMRVRQDDRVQAPVPRRNVSIQGGHEEVRVRAPVHQDPAAAVALEEYRVALADVQNDHVDAPVRPGRHYRSGCRDDEDRPHQRPSPSSARAWLRSQ